MEADPGLPLHLVVWPDGVPHRHEPSAVDPDHSFQVLDHRVTPAFSLPDLVAEVRSGDPDAVVAAVYPSPEAPPPDADWIELSRVAAGEDRGDARRVFTGDTTPTSLQALRRWVSTQATASQRTLDDMVLATSELATNVERHARGWVTVDLVDVDGLMLVGVTDPAVDRFPRLRAVAVDQVSGRGLLVVATVSSLWGVVVRPTSKTVWAAFVD